MPPFYEGRPNAASRARADSASMEGRKMCIGMPKPYLTPGEFQLQVPIDESRGILELSEELVAIVVDGRATAKLWRDISVETMFWNLWRMHKRQDASRLPHVQAFRVKVHVGDITTAVERIGYVQQPREMTTYDMLRTCFHETVRNDIKGLQHALLAHDFNAISTLGLQCQLHFDNAHSPSRFIAVQNWLRRQYVLQGLQLIGADPVMGHAATQLTYWMTALEEALEQYYSWSDAQWSSDSDDDDMVSNSSDDTLTASPAPSAKIDLQPSPTDCASDDLEDIATTDKQESFAAQDPVADVEFVSVGQETFRDLTPYIICDSSKVEGRGASSTIYQGALDLHGTTRLVALKLIHVGHEESTVQFQRLRRELHVWSKLQHPNILPILGVSLEPKSEFPALVSPWCTYGSVVKYITARRDGSYPVYCLVLDMFEQLLAALQYLHERDSPVVHGDIKGINIFVDDAGALKLSDFGLSSTAGRIGSVNLESSNSAGRGTVPYMSKEQFEGASAPTMHSDMWAASCVFFEMWTGLPPYHELPTPVAVILAIVHGIKPIQPPGVTEDLWRLVASNWHVDCLQRLSARSMAGRLYRLRASKKTGEPLLYL